MFQDRSLPKPDPILEEVRWREAVRLETIRGVSDIEERALAANLIGLLVMSLSALALPQPHRGVMIIPLVIRALAIQSTRFGWRRLRTELAKPDVTEDDIRTPMDILQWTLVLGGASWALCFLPVIIDPPMHPARLGIVGGVLVGVSLVSAMPGPSTRLVVAFNLGFLGTLATGLLTAPVFLGWTSFLIILGLVIAFVAYAFASSLQRKSAAVTLIEKRRLADELSRSLALSEFLVRRDPLTGLANRRSFFADSAEYPAGQRPIFLLTMDLDHFKKINDSFGHAMGDRVLVETGRILTSLAEALPEGPHLPVRMGGEEFVLMLHGMGREAALETAGTLLSHIADIGPSLDRTGKLATTGSIGIIELGREETLDQGLARSDGAMYRAKSRGRNQVCV